MKEEKTVDFELQIQMIHEKTNIKNDSVATSCNG
jgi:hypothetical protein